MTFLEQEDFALERSAAVRQTLKTENTRMVVIFPEEAPGSRG
jgi:hypothetical protein